MGHMGHLKIHLNNGVWKRPQALVGLVVVAAFAVIGAYYLSTSHAADIPYVAAEAESGTLASPATIVNDSTASNGQAVQFGTASTGSSEHIITSLYAYPTLSPWTQVESAAPAVKYAIVNICAPDGTGSGCGSPADEKAPAWDPTISALTTAGITPLYYISTNYGALSLSTLESEIQNAITWYGIASPMFDTTAVGGTCSNGGSALPCTTYYNDLYTYAVNAGAAAVVFNPGETVPQSYMFGTKEIIQVYEGTAAGFEGTSFPSWMSSYSPDQFVATLSAGTSSTIDTDVQYAVNDNIGNIYEEDEAEPPNYSTLPAYWSTEVSDVQNAH